MAMLLGKTEAEMIELATSLGEPAYRGKQLYQAIYHRRILNFAEMTELSKPLREKLSQMATVCETTIARLFHATDGTRRYLLRLGDGREAEAVFMPEERRDTICLSCQVGCAVGCAFCMTAQPRFGCWPTRRGSGSAPGASPSRPRESCLEYTISRKSRCARAWRFRSRERWTSNARPSCPSIGNIRWRS